MNMNDIVIGYMSPQPSCEAERDLIEPGAPPEVDVAGVSRAGNKLVERHVQPRARTIVVSCGYGDGRAFSCNRTRKERQRETGTPVPRRN